MTAVEVRDVTAADWPEWRRLWSANCAQFGASIPEADDRELWRRLMDAEHPTGALVAGGLPAAGPLAGLAHYVVHPHTFSQRLVCYLEDLWVEPAARGAGIGRALIEALTARGRRLNWRRIYWHTAPDNTEARALYDRLARATGHIRYEIAL